MKNRLNGFLLILYDATIKVKYSCVDTSPLGTEKFTITLPNATLIKKIHLLQRSTDIMTVCQVEAYGDCMHGTYGLTCSETCKSNCVRQICDPMNGNCLECPLSKHGTKCHLNCPKECVGGCSLFSGQCKKCQPKFMGATCQEQCSPGCKNDGSCMQKNGTCNYGCFLGYVGHNCQKCPSYCVIAEETCKIDDFHCVYGCLTGRYGSTCDKSCSKFCKTSVCDKKTGACASGCQSGYHGPRCVDECSSNYAEGKCDSTNGTCKNCVAGRHGTFCQKKCSLNCLNLICDKKTGHCIDGCKPQFAGPICDKLCTNCAGDGQCSQQSMICSSGCISGFEGETCVVPAKPSVVLPLLLVSFCLISTLASIIYLCVKRTQKEVRGIFLQHNERRYSTCPGNISAVLVQEVLRLYLSKKYCGCTCPRSIAAVLVQEVLRLYLSKKYAAVLVQEVLRLYLSKKYCGCTCPRSNADVHFQGT
ncbi:hypothetical protein Btru_067345 [Bulinus truncatus]|nr:hypothetical protein Btru_067345 [Bulinus truncatus]